MRALTHAETEQRARIRETTLDDTEAGDVFFLLADPTVTWVRDPADDEDAYAFITPGDDQWWLMDGIGTGDPGQPVIVIHNTRKYCALPES